MQRQMAILIIFNSVDTEMIADIGCPNTVIGEADVKRFVQNLSQFQQDNLEVIDADEKFKFGPSGPYKSIEKLRIPIQTEKGSLWVTVSIVNANIPMLLGNNILKPLKANIKLLKAGNGILKIKDVEIKLRETKGGHYTIQVGDLGKLGVGAGSRSSPQKSKKTFQQARYQCDECDNDFPVDETLYRHREAVHEANSYCYACGYSMKSVSDWQKHKETVHGGISKRIEQTRKNFEICFEE